MSDPSHVAENRRHWDDIADQWISTGEQAWASVDPVWGAWRVSNDDYPILPRDMSGMDAIELGCGTAYVSAWMMRRGADSVTAIDNSAKQLETARRLAAEYGYAIDFIEGDAEVVPRPDEAYDFAVSEYGAAIWCEPAAWVREAWRLLRPGGELVFLGNSPLSMACMPLDGSAVGLALVRDYFDLGTIDWRHVDVDPGGVEFNLPISGWFKLFAEVGFSVENYYEIQAPASASGDEFGVSAGWAKRFPSEQIWKLKKALGTY
ncbi:class I SAM-dependent methyltransferase [Acidimicrobiaceae bacterium AH-315-P05]|nr:class I SAM-dependent methyltransferase [Acidimicrobiaceae bacterium AH-315-P05]